MDTARLSAWFQANKTEALMAGGAAVAGLALYNKRKTGTGGTPAGVTAGAVAPGTMPAGAVVSGGSYDSSAFDAYNALQDEIGTLAQQNEAARQTGAGGSGVGAGVTAPQASSLLAPTNSGQYVGYSQGGIYEVEGDGSLYHLSGPEWSQVIAARGGNSNYAGISGAAPGTDYSYIGNLDKKIKTGQGVTGA